MKKEKSFKEALARLEEITKLVKDKNLGIEVSLNLLEEGVDLANFLTQKIDFLKGNDESHPAATQEN